MFNHFLLLLFLQRLLGNKSKQSCDKKHQQNSKKQEDEAGQPEGTRSLQHLTYTTPLGTYSQRSFIVVGTSDLDCFFLILFG